MSNKLSTCFPRIMRSYPMSWIDSQSSFWSKSQPKPDRSIDRSRERERERSVHKPSGDKIINLTRLRRRSRRRRSSTSSSSSSSSSHADDAILALPVADSISFFLFFPQILDVVGCSVFLGQFCDASQIGYHHPQKYLIHPFYIKKYMLPI